MSEREREQEKTQQRCKAVHPTYLIERKQILLDFLTMRVVSLPSEPKLHHPDAVSEMQHNPAPF